MLTYVLRHATTAYSRSYRVNGDPRMPIGLDPGGEDACRRLAGSAAWPAAVRTCFVSRFPRTMQTARILLGPAGPPILVDRRLDEVSYGAFEGRPWTEYGDWLDRHGRNAIPPDADESLREAQARMLTALAARLVHPGPRLAVAHGCLLALISSLRQTGQIGGVILPGTAPLDMVWLPDGELARLVRRGAAQLEAARTPP